MSARLTELVDSAADAASRAFPLLVATALESPFLDVREGLVRILKAHAEPLVSSGLLDFRVQRYLDTPQRAPSAFISLNELVPFPPDPAGPGAGAGAGAVATSPPSGATAGVSAGDEAPGHTVEGAGEDDGKESAGDSWAQRCLAAAAIFQDCAVSSGRVSNLVRVLAWHPTYLRVFLDAHQAIMSGDGPLPIPWRHFVGMLASASHGCQYLFRRCRADFLACGGDPEWARGGLTSTHIPRKLVSLGLLNSTMAHQPWMVKKEMVDELVAGDLAWSVTELVHVMVIMATYHSLSSLVLGLGIVSEPDIMEAPVVLSATPPVGDVAPPAGPPSPSPASPKPSPMVGSGPPDPVALPTEGGASRKTSASESGVWWACRGLCCSPAPSLSVSPSSSLPLTPSHPVPLMHHFFLLAGPRTVQRLGIQSETHVRAAVAHR